jgi:transcriptional regulator with PAS, ATPase and Fis domain
LFARALHELARPRGPFFALNCAAIPEGLIDSELFGYVDGAFTGGRKGGAAGKIEQAHGGVLFLDEIGDMPLAMQSRLLRVVQEHVVTRIGGSEELPVDILVLSATHQPLAEMVQRKEFREDLYYRLNGFTLHLPPLRERADLADIAAELLFQCDAAENGGRRRQTLDEIICPAAFARLTAYGWPGNVRQLEQTLRGLVALRDSSLRIELEHLPEWLRSGHAVNGGAHEEADGKVATLKAVQDSLVRRTLREHGGNMSATARALGISRTTVYNRLRRNPLPAGD